MDRLEHVAMTTKMWSTDAEWHPFAQQNPLELHRLDSSGNQIFPQGTPEIVAPNVALRQRLLKNVKTIKKL